MKYQFKIFLTRKKIYIHYYYLKIHCTNSKQIFSWLVFYINGLYCASITVNSTLNQLKPIFQGNKNKAKQAKHLNRWLTPVALNEK